MMNQTRILIIHPSRTIRELLSECVALETGNIEPLAVASAQEAEKLLDSRHFDVVISSLVLDCLIGLAEKDTHVVVLVRDEFDEILQKLPDYGIRHHLTLPVNRQNVQNMIHSILRKGNMIRSPRFDTPGAKAYFHIGSSEIEGDVINIGEDAVLVQIEIEEDYHHLLQDNVLTLVFPKQFGSIVLREIHCRYLTTRKAERKGYRTELQVALQFPVLQGKQLAGLRKVLKKAARIQHPLLKWQNNRLELRAFKTTRFFYKIHLLRIALVLVLTASGLALLIDRMTEKDLTLIWANGDVFIRQDGETGWQKAAVKEFKSTTGVSIDGLDSSQPETSDHTESEIWQGRFTETEAVLRYSPSELVILAKGGKIQRSTSGETTRYQLSGAVHILLNPRNDDSAYRLSINGIHCSTRTAHLFFQDLTDRPELTAVQGTLVLQPLQELFLVVNEGIQPKDGLVHLDTSHSLLFHNDLVALEPRTEKPVRWFDETYLPGFTVGDEFEQLGYAILESGSYTLRRHSTSYPVLVRRIPIMVRDSLETNAEGKVMLVLFNGDRFRLYENSEVGIIDYEVPDEFPILPLMIGVNAQELQGLTRSSLTLKGRLRATINPEVKRRDFRLRSANAVIGVKGTDFETLDSAEKTEVLTVSGSVTFSDRDERQSVTVTQGMMSSLGSEQAPQEPVKIPKDRLSQLLIETLDTEGELQLSLLNTISTERIVLNPGARISLFWNAALKHASVSMANKDYQTILKPGSPEMIIEYAMFAGAKTGTHSAIIRVTDDKGRTKSLDTTLELKPRIETIRFAERILFEKSKSVIKEESSALLDEIVARIQRQKGVQKISIEGHSDSEGAEAFNVELSRLRAEAVKTYLADNGIAKNVLSAAGFGSSRPLVSDDKPTEQGKNRRVEFVLAIESNEVF
jgi:outer membrane protein OmpA-like peptidoglycan-associated protein/CheY-like chemotaxis protein